MPKTNNKSGDKPALCKRCPHRGTSVCYSCTNNMSGHADSGTSDGHPV